MIKLIITDMDGTLLDDSGSLDRDFFDVLDKLLELDIIFVVASGRQYYQLMNNFEHYADCITYIAENGSLVMAEGKELYTSTLDRENIVKILNDIEELDNITTVLCGRKAAYFNADDKGIFDEVRKYYYSYEILGDFSKIDDDILKIALYDLSTPENNSYRALHTKWKDRFQLTISAPQWMDIYNIGTNKGKAVKLLQEKYGIKKEETMVFGDYYNDIDMFEYAFYSYAMENAPDDVKEKARFIAKKNSEKGVIEILNKLI